MPKRLCKIATINGIPKDNAEFGGMIVMFIDEAFETVVTTHNFGIPEIPGKLNGSFSEA